MKVTVNGEIAQVYEIFKIIFFAKHFHDFYQI